MKQVKLLIYQKHNEEVTKDQIDDLVGYEEYEEDVELLSNALEETRTMLEKFNKLWEEMGIRRSKRSSFFLCQKYMGQVMDMWYFEKKKKKRISSLLSCGFLFLYHHQIINRKYSHFPQVSKLFAD